MNTDIDYSEFNVERAGDLEVGAHFIWAGELYQKTGQCWIQDKNIKGCTEPEWIYKNAVKVASGKLFYFFDEELIVPAEAQIKVKP